MYFPLLPHLHHPSIVALRITKTFLSSCKKPHPIHRLSSYWICQGIFLVHLMLLSPPMTFFPLLTVFLTECPPHPRLGQESPQCLLTYLAFFYKVAHRNRLYIFPFAFHPQRGRSVSGALFCSLLAPSGNHLLARDTFS